MRRIMLMLLAASLLLSTEACSGNKTDQAVTPPKLQGIGAVKSDVLLRLLADRFLQTPEDYQNNNDRLLFITHSGSAWINVDGENVELEQYFEKEKAEPANAEDDEQDVGEPPSYKVGDTFKETYQGKDMKAWIDFKVTEIRPNPRLPADLEAKVAVVEAVIKIESKGVARQAAARGAIGVVN